MDGSSLDRLIVTNGYIDTSVPVYIQSKLLVHCDGQLYQVEVIFDKYHTQKFYFKSENHDVILELYGRLSVEEPKIDFMIPKFLNPQSALRVSKRCTSAEVQEIMRQLESALESLDINALHRLRSSKHLYDIGVENFFSELISWVTLCREEGVESMQKKPMQCGNCFECENVMGFVTDDPKCNFGLKYHFEADDPIEIYPCQYPIAEGSTEPVDFTYINEITEKVKLAIELNDKNMLLSSLATDCKVSFSFYNRNGDQIETFAEAYAIEGMNLLFEIMEDHPRKCSIGYHRDIGWDDSQIDYLDNLSYLEVDCIVFSFILSIQSVYTKKAKSIRLTFDFEEGWDESGE